VSRRSDLDDDMTGESFVKKKKDRERAIKQARQAEERLRIQKAEAATRIQAAARSKIAKRITAALHKARHRTPKQVLADRYQEWLDDRRKTRQSGYGSSPLSARPLKPVLFATPLKSLCSPETQRWQENQALLRRPGFTRSLTRGSAPALLPPRPAQLKRAATESSISQSSISPLARFKSLSLASPRRSLSLASPRRTTVQLPDQMSDGPPTTPYLQYPSTHESSCAAEPATSALSRVRRVSSEAGQHMRRISNEVCERLTSRERDRLSRIRRVSSEAGQHVRRISNEVCERLTSSPGFTRPKPGGVMDGVVDSWRAHVRRVSNELFA